MIHVPIVTGRTWCPGALKHCRWYFILPLSQPLWPNFLRKDMLYFFPPLLLFSFITLPNSPSFCLLICSAKITHLIPNYQTVSFPLIVFGILAVLKVNVPEVTPWAFFSIFCHSLDNLIHPIDTDVTCILVASPSDLLPRTLLSQCSHPLGSIAKFLKLLVSKIGLNVLAPKSFS